MKTKCFVAAAAAAVNVDSATVIASHCIGVSITVRWVRVIPQHWVHFIHCLTVTVVQDQRPW